LPTYANAVTNETTGRAFADVPVSDVPADVQAFVSAYPTVDLTTPLPVPVPQSLANSRAEFLARRVEYQRPNSPPHTLLRNRCGRRCVASFGQCRSGRTSSPGHRGTRQSCREARMVPGLCGPPTTSIGPPDRWLDTVRRCGARKYYGPGWYGCFPRAMPTWQRSGRRTPSVPNRSLRR